MADQRVNKEANRRSDVRLASNKTVSVTIVDRYEQPIAVLPSAEIANVSAGGMMLVSDTPAPCGARMKVTLDQSKEMGESDQRFYLEALRCSPGRDSHHQINCKLVQGNIPAKLIHGW